MKNANLTLRIFLEREKAYSLNADINYKNIGSFRVKYLSNSKFNVRTSMKKRSFTVLFLLTMTNFLSMISGKFIYIRTTLIIQSGILKYIIFYFYVLHKKMLQNVICFISEINLIEALFVTLTNNQNKKLQSVRDLTVFRYFFSILIDMMM